ncbi:zinc ABC transporter substrate-binding protein [Clostridium sp.]|uniref:metal ABC transporter substrate-binding protein n=1 Tax=Clostridium sp. TaxID=1506 RepID=UPI00261F4FA5|nr:zinc ABC transporter substrate-binding protein [Clostridium sp.]
MKKLTYGLVIFTLILFVGLNYFYSPLMAIPTNKVDEEKDKPLNIMTVSKTQYELVKTLTKDKHNVDYLLENEKEINSFIINEDIIKRIFDMDLLIYNGLGYEKWMNKLMNEVKNSNLGIINMSKGIIPLIKELGNKEENPYYLFGLNEYKIALYNIKISLQEKDIKNRLYYEENYNEKVEIMEKFYESSKNEISKYKDFIFIVDSDRLDYLFRDLNIKVEKISKENIDKFSLEYSNKEEKIIYVNDKNEETLLDKIKLNIEDLEYIELSTELNEEELKNNIKLIIEAIKNN